MAMVEPSGPCVRRRVARTAPVFISPPALVVDGTRLNTPSRLSVTVTVAPFVPMDSFEWFQVASVVSVSALRRVTKMKCPPLAATQIHALAHLRDAGLDVSGEVGDASPLRAVGDAL